MKSIKYLFLGLISSCLSIGLWAQNDLCENATPGAGGLAWIDPAVPDVNDSVYIYIDVSKDPNCTNLVGSEEPLFIWTWSPVSPAEAKQGMWNNSGDDAMMEQVDGDIWRFGMIPTEYYGAEAEEIYARGFCFLAKQRDGGSGGDCNDGGEEFKSTDMHLSVPSPFVTQRKVYSYPEPVEGDTLLSRSDDVFTLFYNNRVESKETMINVDEMWIYFRLEGDDGVEYSYSTLFDVGNNPELMMQNDGNNLFSFSFIPDDFLAGVLPEGVKAHRLRLQLLRWPFNDTDDAVDGDYYFTFRCN
ncbi:MAG: hypothetical protein AAFP19_21280 [Bacteroidota bacterium]